MQQKEGVTILIPDSGGMRMLQGSEANRWLGEYAVAYMEHMLPQLRPAKAYTNGAAVPVKAAPKRRGTPGATHQTKLLRFTEQELLRIQDGLARPAHYGLTPTMVTVLRERIFNHTSTGVLMKQLRLNSHTNVSDLTKRALRRLKVRVKKSRVWRR